jgi:hypothetical protein
MSAILTDGLARRAANRVLGRAGNAAEGFADLNTEVPIEGTYPIPDSETDRNLDYMVDQTFTFDRAILSYKPAIEEKAPDKFTIGVLAQIRDFLVFGVDKVLKIPYFALLWIWRRVVRAVNKVFQGGDKGASTIPEPEEKMDRRDLVLQQQRDQVFEIKTKADQALQSPVTPSQIRSTPELWSNVRKLIFGMLDGSNLQNFGFKKSDNGWPIFYKVSSLFNDPGRELQIPDPSDQSKVVTIGWNGLTEATEASLATFNRVTSVEEEITKGVEEIVALNAKIEELKTQIGNDGLVLGKHVSLTPQEEIEVL